MVILSGWAITKQSPLLIGIGTNLTTIEGMKIVYTCSNTEKLSNGTIFHVTINITSCAKKFLWDVSSEYYGDIRTQYRHVRWFSTL